MSKNIWSIVTQNMKDRKEATLVEVVDDAFVNYNKAGFEINEFHADNQMNFGRPFESNWH